MVKKMDHWFSLSIARDEAFCNRVKEREHLIYNFKQNIHTLLISPRRYGKTSLALKAISESELPYIAMDFTLASDKNSVQNIINSAIGSLLTKIMPMHKKVLHFAAKFFSNMQPQLILDTQSGMRIKLHPNFASPQLAINEILLCADKFAVASKKHAVILMDEFQQIALLEDGITIEAAIRNAAQAMQNISIIFAGSNRHMMQLIFDDQSRPFYHLCDRIDLKRIAAEDYKLHLQKAAKLRWKCTLPDEYITQIFILSQLHPYYLNIICSRLWRGEKIFSLAGINLVWQEYIAEEKDRIGADIAKLSAHQQQLLLLFAAEEISQPTSKNVINKLNASVGSISKAFKVLLQNDYIYLDDKTNSYKILDPLVAEYLKIQAKILF